MGFAVLTADTKDAWSNWISLAKSRCHLHFELEGGTLDTHIAAALATSRSTAARIANDLPSGLSPKRILEVGGSVGFNSIALAERFPEATIHSVEPDAEAVELAVRMARDLNLDYSPKRGVGEALDYADQDFDLVICHTVIEHVSNVEMVVAEMARVLSPSGIIHLEAPNYLWPYEPHLDVWCIPLLGKRMLKIMAFIQGKSDDNWYADHLQFVTPFRLERAFRKAGLRWENRVKSKFSLVLNGAAQAERYTGIAKIMKYVHKWGLSGLLINFSLFAGVYPSVLYTAYKHK